MTRTQIEKKFKVRIADDSYFAPNGRFVKMYKIYSADGCRWETGMKTLKAVYDECMEWKDALLKIAANVAKGV